MTKPTNRQLREQLYAIIQAANNLGRVEESYDEWCGTYEEYEALHEEAEAEVEKLRHELHEMFNELMPPPLSQGVPQ